MIGRTRKILALITRLNNLKWLVGDDTARIMEEASDALAILVNENIKLRRYTEKNALLQHGGVINIGDTKLEQHSNMILDARKIIRELDREVV